MPRNRLPWIVGAALLVAIPVATAVANSDTLPRTEQSTIAQVGISNAFTYQGRLTDDGTPATGDYDIRFILYDAESGGAQVGPSVTDEDLEVEDGLFTTTLNFGGDAFTGEARWLELAVRPAASTDAFTVLSPRQPITPTPYALYAVSAGSFDLPFSGAGTSADVPLFEVEQEGSASAIRVERSYEGAEDGDAIAASNDGAGAAVSGVSSADGGIGVEGRTTSTDGTAGRFQGNSANTAAIELVNGRIKVSGGGTLPAFVHTVDTTAETGNTCVGDAGTIISHPYANGDPFAFLVVTPVGSNVMDAVTGVSVIYAPADCDGASGRWVIAADEALETGDQFNVLVINRPGAE